MEDVVHLIPTAALFSNNMKQMIVIVRKEVHTVKIVMFPHIGAQWNTTFLHWWSVKCTFTLVVQAVPLVLVSMKFSFKLVVHVMLLKLVFSEVLHYIVGQQIRVLLDWLSIERDLFTSVISGKYASYTGGQWKIFSLH